MTKVLLTGGSGFIAAHILEQLLAKGHHVVTTVRSEAKAAPIRAAYPDKSPEELTIAIVPDIAQPSAFDEVVKIPGIEVVLHTASPFHFKFTELIDPAVLGTTSILSAITRSAPTVRRVVITSSFAAIMDESLITSPTTTFSESSWNPVTLADIHRSPATAELQEPKPQLLNISLNPPLTHLLYRASKTLAEGAAWAFVATHQPKFDLATINPPMVFGPVAHHLESVEGINTSNERLVSLVRGGWKDGVPDTGAAIIWVDVRDVAEAHVKAGLEVAEAGGRRLFTTAGTFSNREMAEIVRRRFPELGDKVPGPEVEGGELPGEGERFKFNNEETTRVLGIRWRGLEESVVDTVKSLLALGA
ncbi:hypothetical protein B0T18DRAFT_432000 [Schizothecium vesticola]|uniref:NAD-dependent epimerase/dehydratase domain-containing protein n=1 Tax=Schizothecium vesticola TaxID=314040 RepID=A0AA40EK14_9PEZI|nr:hypothetical protein B0T18DRAFT_432000 [Schizothecium vesticola]